MPTIAVHPATPEDMNQLISIYKKIFKKHYVFELPANEIMKYLLDKHEANKEVGGLLVAVKNGTVLGGLLVKKSCFDAKGKHLVVKYNHLAVKVQGKGVGSILVKYAESLLKKKIKAREVKTIKIEADVAENEQKSLEFYKKHGFKVEGKLQDHFRAKELVYAIGKMMK